MAGAHDADRADQDRDRTELRPVDDRVITYRMALWVYMLRCTDGSFYVGSATGEQGLARRLHEHETGVYPGYTSSRRPVTLVWSNLFADIKAGVAFERQLKGWSRAKKIALIDGRFEDLPALASRRSGQRADRSSS